MTLDRSARTLKPQPNQQNGYDNAYLIRLAVVGLDTDTYWNGDILVSVHITFEEEPKK